MNFSQVSHSNYPLYSRRLSPGWLFGRNVVSLGLSYSQKLVLNYSQDNSDSQYRSFRSNVPALTVLVFAFLILKSIYALPAFKFSPARPRDTLHKIPFLIFFSVLMLIGLHGTSILKIFAILGANFVITKYGRGRKWIPFVTWGFNGAILFLNEINSGYRFASLHPSFEVLVRFVHAML